MVLFLASIVVGALLFSLGLVQGTGVLIAVGALLIAASVVWASHGVSQNEG